MNPIRKFYFLIQIFINFISSKVFLLSFEINAAELKDLIRVFCAWRHLHVTTPDAHIGLR